MRHDNPFLSRNAGRVSPARRLLLAATFFVAVQGSASRAEAQPVDAASPSPTAALPATTVPHRHHYYRHHYYHYHRHLAAAPSPQSPAPGVQAQPASDKTLPPAKPAPVTQHEAASAAPAPATSRPSLRADVAPSVTPSVAATPPAPAPVGVTPAMFVTPHDAGAHDEGAQTGAGPGLTPMGAIRAGNADGTIPAWTGGLMAAPGNKPIRARADPFASERPLFSITAQNVDRYADKLAPGTIALIRTIRGYHVDVYPTHRTAAEPQYIYDNAIANMSRARLVHGGDGVEGAVLSVPFPIPHNGNEAIWNHTLRFRGTQIVRTVSNVISTPSGDYALQRWHEDIMLPYNTPNLANPTHIDSLYRQELLAPPRDAGSLVLLVNHENPTERAREAWSYNPGERRVRRAPEIDYDTPLTDTDGLETVDDYDLFNGSTDRYDWTLVGRREMYIPYNTYRLQDTSLHYTDLIGPESIKPEYIRFELHRVWVVDAKLKPGYGHIYTRRTLYLDEDSWTGVISDRYDGRGNLWRTAMAFPVELSEVPVLFPDGFEYIDLFQHRYLMQGLHNEEPVAPVWNATVLTENDYSADALRRMGKR